MLQQISKIPIPQEIQRIAHILAVADYKQHTGTGIKKDPDQLQ